MKTILSVRNLKTSFAVRKGLFQRVSSHVKAVNDVSLEVKEGEIVSIVGESGCGKSTLGKSILGLIRAQEGHIYFDSEQVDLLNLSSWKEHRKNFQMIFQDPYLSLNPRLTIFESISEPLLVHKICSKKELKEKVAELLEQVDLQPDMMFRFPHAFSGGQRQRISIARVLGVSPKLIICDEIVSALDVSVQAQILELLLKLKEVYKLSLLFISHDLAVVKHLSDMIHVMYLGKIVESAPCQDLFKHPRHPYTQALIASIPTLDRNKKPQLLRGEVPSAIDLPRGCFFSSRCQYKSDLCQQLPQMNEDGEHQFACHYPLP